MNSPLAGKTIAVIGAGPAGAIAALLLARSKQARVLAFERRPLLRRPAAGDRAPMCGGCGGLVQAGVLARLGGLGLSLGSVVQEDLAGYTVHYPKRNLRFDIASPGMVSVYRGWGAKRGADHGESFDSYLACQACAAGAEFHEEAVTRIQLGDGKTTPVAISTAQQVYEADFVIGAFGHSQALERNIVDATSQPAPLDKPDVQRGAIREYEFGQTFVDQTYGRRVHVLTDPTPNVWFAALVPKGSGVTMVLMPRHDTTAADFDELFGRLVPLGLAPAGSARQSLACACTRSSLTTWSPRRFLIPGEGGIALIGDAGPSRPRKNGLFAAIDLAQHLVKRLEARGYSAAALRGFWMHAAADYVADDIFADAMLKLTGGVPNMPILGRLTMHAVAGGRNIPLLSAAMREYGRLMLTGECPYWRIPAAVAGSLIRR